MAGATVSRTAHFALHRTELDASGAARFRGRVRRRLRITRQGLVQGSQALFAVREPWVGALIPKRWAKRAVTRNAIKRQIYAVSQSLEARIAGRRACGAAARRVRSRAVHQRHLRCAQGTPCAPNCKSCSPRAAP